MKNDRHSYGKTKNSKVLRARRSDRSDDLLDFVRDVKKLWAQSLAQVDNTSGRKGIDMQLEAVDEMFARRLDRDLRALLVTLDTPAHALAFPKQQGIAPVMLTDYSSTAKAVPPTGRDKPRKSMAATHASVESGLSASRGHGPGEPVQNNHAARG